MHKTRIKSVQAHLLYHPLEKPLEFSFGIKKERTTALIEIETDDGLVGWGEANWGGSLQGGKSLLTLITERVRPTLVGKNPFNAEAIWRSMDELSFDGNRVSALGAVDIALWDLQGQAMGVPISELLGGATRTHVSVYGSGLMIVPIPELIRDAQTLVEQGFEGVKMRIGRNPQEDPDRVRAVREAIGSRIKLFVDANGNYNRREALRVGHALEELGVEHYEEPLPKWDIEGYALLASQIKTPLAAGECTNLFNMKELLARNASQVILPDVTINGFTETRKILALAEAFRTDVVMHNFEAAIGLAGTLHVAAANPLMKQLQEVDQNPNPFRDELLETPLEFVKGAYKVPTAPGMGIKINRRVVEKYRIGHTA
jgi:D-galactarolactone cycloisomerase